MQTIHVKFNTNKKIADALSKNILTKSAFEDFVYQAFFYPDCEIIVGNVTFRGRTAYTSMSKGHVTERVYWHYSKACEFLWYKVRAVKTFRFRSKLEDTEYIIEDADTKQE